MSPDHVFSSLFGPAKFSDQLDVSSFPAVPAVRLTVQLLTMLSKYHDQPTSSKAYTQ